MERSPNISSTCPFSGVNEGGVVRSTNTKYREKVAKINEKVAAANLYTVDDDVPWFWPDENLAQVLAIRKDRFENEPDRVLHTGNDDPAIRAATAQLLMEQSNYLASHFPDVYAMEIDDDDRETITNIVTSDTYSVRPGDSDLHPLAISGLLGQEDICIVRHMDDGREVLVAGFLATPTGWDLADFVGRDLDGIHHEVEGYLVPLPGYNRPLKDTVDKVFVRLRGNRQLKLARNNVLLYQNPSQTLLPERPLDLNPDIVTDPGNQIFIRSEYETLTTIDDEFAAFTIAPKVIPIAEFVDSPRLPEVVKYLEGDAIPAHKKALAQKALAYLPKQ